MRRAASVRLNPTNKRLACILRMAKIMLVNKVNKEGYIFLKELFVLYTCLNFDGRSA